MRTMNKRLAWLPCLLLTAPGLAASPILDDFAYPDSPSAQAAWTALGGSLPVQMADAGAWGNERVMKLPCDFTSARDRSYWDRSVALDLTPYTEIALEVFVPDPGAVAQLTLYFRSGAGWYGRGVGVESRGWQTLVFSIRDFRIEGTPAGWDQIDGIRLSPWKESAEDTFLAVRELRAFTPSVLVVLDTHTSDATTAQSATQLVAGWLGGARVPVGVIDDTAVEAGRLAGSRLVILPFNNTLSDTALTRLETFVGSGGKLMVFYTLEDRIAAQLGFRATGWTRGDFAAYTFQDSQIQHLPARVRQDSWNITIAAPAGQFHARVIAGWEDSAGKPTGHPAWLASDNGLFMSHVLLPDDAETKQYMLLALVAHYVPEIWPGAAVAAIESIGKIADYLTYEQAVAEIGAKGGQSPRAAQVLSALAEAETLRNQALAQRDAGQYTQAIRTAKDARARLLRAYFLCQTPVWPEFRAVWEHSGTGPYPGDWAAAIDVLADNHFTAVFPNMLWGGLAHYDSALLPHSETFDTYGDQLTACIRAAHARGVAVHVWKVNWNLSHAPQSFIDAMRVAGRTQVNRWGEPVDWLCPSHPANFALERDSMLEVVANYEVDGIHFDYIRYPDSDHCYCDGCRTRFEAQTGNVVASWPADVVEGGRLQSAFLDWRRAQITNLVAAVYEGVKATKPQVQVSAAVFPGYSQCRDGVGQDWVSWIDRGIVDFLCPMDYTNDFDRFADLVTEQIGYSAGRVPIYPGIGASTSRSSFGPDGVIEQVQETRAQGTGGFILFNFDHELATEDLPALGLGTTLAVEADGHAPRRVLLPYAGSDAGSGANPDAGLPDGGNPDGGAERGRMAGDW
jgi:uncharacterized lipoprotein YddW (UPF0748 family)